MDKLRPYAIKLNFLAFPLKSSTDSEISCILEAPVDRIVGFFVFAISLISSWSQSSVYATLKKSMFNFLNE